MVGRQNDIALFLALGRSLSLRTWLLLLPILPATIRNITTPNANKGDPSLTPFQA